MLGGATSGVTSFFPVLSRLFLGVSARPIPFQCAIRDGWRRRPEKYPTRRSRGRSAFFPEGRPWHRGGPGSGEDGVVSPHLGRAKLIVLARGAEAPVW